MPHVSTVCNTILGYMSLFLFITEFARQTDELEQNHDQEQGHGQDMSSQDNSDDDDDEATLREQLLKSLAVKRKAKLDVGVKYVKINLHLVQMNNNLCGQYQNCQRQVSVSLVLNPLKSISCFSKCRVFFLKSLFQARVQITSGNRTEWSPIQSVIVQVIYKIR